jgi:hydroxysqualene dehydroxylase
MLTKSSKTPQVFIVGGGWAGLSCAVNLKQQGFSNQLFEASRQLGGRARCTKYKGLILDNGQHILSGACQETLDLFQLLGMKETDFIYRQPLKLELLAVNLLSTNSQNLHIHPANLPAPFHLLFAFLKAKNIKLKDKYYLIKFFILLRIINYHISPDNSLINILKKHQQSIQIIDQFWEPLCLAIMNSPIHIASANIFLNVLKKSFSGQKQNSDLLLFSKPLCETLPQHALQFIHKQSPPHSGKIHFNSRVDAIVIKDNSVSAIKVGNQELNCSKLILATPVHISAKLLAAHQNCSTLVQSLQEIDYQPIYTVYLYYQQCFELPEYMTGLLNGYSQWVFDKRFSQQKGLLAVIISGPGKHQKISRDELINQVNLELQAVFSLPELDWGIVLIEKKATINCSVTNNKLRPSNQTPIKGLYLAGDYTDTGYPSTLEGAVLSGKTAAELISKK